jgi:hypothetical protein
MAGDADVEPDYSGEVGQHQAQILSFGFQTDRVNSILLSTPRNEE